MTDAIVNKANAYAIMHTGGPGASVRAARGVALLSHSSNASAGVSKVTAYQLYANPAVCLKASGYLHTYPAVHAPVIKASGYLLYTPLFPPTLEFNVDFDLFEERFPDCISFSSSGGPGFKTNVVEFDSGIVSVNPEWSRIRAEYVVNFETATLADIKLVEDFFYVAKGRGVAFRFKDWQDYQIVQQNFAVGDGTTAAFPLFKRYESGTQYYDRLISKPLIISSNGDDMQVTVDGILQVMNGDVFVNQSTGLISFQVPPPPGALVRIEYAEFDVPVRFDTDTLDISFDEFRQLSLEVPLIEVRT